MNVKDDGGWAFPHETGTTYYHGMTLRDYFAAHAQYGDIHNTMFVEDADGRGTKVMTAEEARYVYADRMIAASKNQSEEK